MIRSTYFRYFTLLCFILICSICNAQKPKAGFYANKTEGCAPLQVSFFDTSSNSPTAWRWDFGDGGAKSFFQNPQRTYDIPGTYTAELIATNADGSDTVTITNYINVYDIPTADFSATPPSGCAPLVVQFDDQSTTGSGAIVKWEWFMGDGEIDSIQNPQHTYTGNKNYNVTLIITDEFGCSDSKVDQIATIKPTADFSVNISSICEDTLTVKFTNNSSGADTLTYNWDFGDTDTSSEENPEHFYSKFGSYTVTLLATENECTDNATITINLIDFQPGFEADDTVICLGATIKFTDTTINSGTKTWFWGDGKKTTTTGTSINKKYTTSGTYTVQMIVNSTGNACQQTVSRTNYIVVNPIPDVKFSVDDSIPCQKGTVLNFSDNFSGTDTLMWIIWNRPDTSKAGIVLSEPVRDTLYGTDPNWSTMVEDSFNVFLTVKDQNGCELSLTKDEYIILKDPEAYISAFPLKGCIPLEVFFFDNNSFAYFGDSVISYEWEFIDPFATGATNASGATASYTWDSSGTYYAKFRIETMRGCTAVNYQNVYPGEKPTAGMKLPSFTSNGPGVRDTSLCYGAYIWFRDSSQGTIDEYIWTIPYLADSNNDKQGSGGGILEQYLFTDTLEYFDIIHIVGYHECYDTVIFTAITDTSVDMSTMPDSVIRINIKGPIPGFRSDSLILIADTLLTVQDTFYLGKDTIYISAYQEITGPDTTFIAAAYDTFYTATDTILIPNAWNFTVSATDTFTVKTDTIYNTADTVITSADTIYLPPDTVYIPDNQQEVIACPDTIIVKFQTEAILSDSIIWVFEFPNDTISGHPDSVIRDTNIIKKGTFGTYGSPF
ncbi:PKD domain-containing protein, partial [Cytophagaceae bacterium AH-315-L13]|nr:PKD domain-containing protein [Cytophagaceae bacterium AH-315-L13]